MGLSCQVRGEDLVDDIAVAQGLDGQCGDGRLAVEPRQRGEQLVVGPGFIAEQNPPLHRALAEQVPRVGKLQELETFSRGNYTLFRAYLENHRDELRVDDLELASFVCVTSIEALTHQAVLHYPGMLSGERMDALINEGARLVTGYLKG